MSYTVQPVVVPDFAGAMMRGQQFTQQREMNALAMMAQQRQMDNQQRYENALMDPAVLSGMTSADPSARQQAYNILAQRGGVQGFQAALPLITEERKQAGFQDAMGRVFGAPQAAAAATPAAPPISPDLMPHFIAASRETGVPVPVLLAVAQQESRAGRDPRATANGGGVMQVTAGTARDPGFGVPPMDPAARLDPAQNILFGARYLAARAKDAGVTNWSDPAQRARVLGAYNGGGDPNYVPNVERHMPGGVPAQGGRRLPTVEQLFALMGTGNPQAMELAGKLAPLVAQANPNMVQMEQGGRVFMVNPQNPAQRIDMGPKQDPRGQAPAGYRFAQDGGLEPIPGGPVGQENQRQDFTNTRQLREEFNGSQAAKDFAIMRPNMEAIRKAVGTDSRAADIDMVFAFAKMLDPNSVVREGEQLQLMRTGGVFDTIAGYISGLNGGGRLTDDVRRNLAAQAESRFSIAADQYDDRLNYYRGLAEDGGFNPNHIGRPAQGRQAQPGRDGGSPNLPRVSSPADAARLPSGTRFLDPNGVERVVP